MKKVCSVIICTAFMLSFGVLTCNASPVGIERPVFSLAPEFLHDDAGEFMFHALPWESTVEETEAGLNVSIGEPDFTGPDYLPTKNTRYFRSGEFSFPFLEDSVRQMLEYDFVDGKLRNIEATIYEIREMSKDDVYENLMLLYLDTFGEPLVPTEYDTFYTEEQYEMLTMTTIWIADPRPDGMATFLSLRGHIRGNMYCITNTGIGGLCQPYRP